MLVLFNHLRKIFVMILFSLLKFGVHVKNIGYIQHLDYSRYSYTKIFKSVINSFNLFPFNACSFTYPDVQLTKKQTSIPRLSACQLSKTDRLQVNAFDAGYPGYIGWCYPSAPDAAWPRFCRANGFPSHWKKWGSRPLLLDTLYSRSTFTDLSKTSLWKGIKASKEMRYISIKSTVLP